METQYKNLILVIFNEQQLREYKAKYYSSSDVTIFDIANEMKTQAKDLIDHFDFLDFAEAVIRQPDATIPKTTDHQDDEKLLRRF